MAPRESLIDAADGLIALLLQDRKWRILAWKGSTLSAVVGDTFKDALDGALENLKESQP